MGQERIDSLGRPAHRTAKAHRRRKAGRLRPAPPSGSANLVFRAELRSSGACALDRQVGCDVCGVAVGNLSHVRSLQNTEKPRGSDNPPEPVNRSNVGLLPMAIIQRLPFIKSAYTFRNVLNRWFTHRSRLKLHTLGVVYWPSRSAKRVFQHSPDESPDVSALGFFFACIPTLGNRISKAQPRSASGRFTKTLFA